MTFLQIVELVKILKSHVAVEAEAILKACNPEYQPGLGLDAFSPGSINSMLAPTPINDLFNAYLNTLDFHTLHKIAGLYYSGRNREDLADSMRSIQSDTKEQLIIIIDEKTPLANFVDQGLERASSIGIDIESV